MRAADETRSPLLACCISRQQRDFLLEQLLCLLPYRRMGSIRQLKETWQQSFTERLGCLAWEKGREVVDCLIQQCELPVL